MYSKFYYSFLSLLPCICIFSTVFSFSSTSIFLCLSFFLSYLLVPVIYIFLHSSFLSFLPPFLIRSHGLGFLTQPSFNRRKLNVKFIFRFPPGTYVIVPSTFAADEEGQFVIRVFAEKGFQAQEG